MSRIPIRAFILTMVVAIAASAGLARAADTLFVDVSRVLPSDLPGLLPAITAEGRKGWDCTAEQRARAGTIAGADLPPAP
jgi:hypothetical protein